MKRVRAKYPYNDYYLYIVFHKKQNRNYANLIPIDPSKNRRKTISYARYLMSVKEQRILNRDEQVDHIDNNKQNDRIENLQILTVKENNQKEAIHRGGCALVELKCPNCGKIFVKMKNHTFIKQGGNYTACSRKYSGTFGMKIKKSIYNKADEQEVKQAILENVIREFRSVEG